MLDQFEPGGIGCNPSLPVRHVRFSRVTRAAVGRPRSGETSCISNCIAVAPPVALIEAQPQPGTLAARGDALGFRCAASSMGQGLPIGAPSVPAIPRHPSRNSIPEVFGVLVAGLAGTQTGKGLRDRGIQRLFCRLSPAAQPSERVDRWACWRCNRWRDGRRAALAQGHWRTATVVLPQQTAAAVASGCSS